MLTLSRFLNRRRTSKRKERGATMVEAAFVTPLFFLLVFAIFEFGYVFRTYLLTTSAASAGGRAASIASSGRDSDFQVLRSVEQELGVDNLSRLKSVVVYKADGPDSTITPACLSNPVPAGSDCNRYGPGDFLANYTDSAGTYTSQWGCGSGALDAGWCPLERDNLQSSPNNSGYVGVYIAVEHEYISGMFGGSRTIVVDRVFRLEA